MRLKHPWWSGLVAAVLIGLMMALAHGVLVAARPADAQPAEKTRRIGYLSLNPPPESSADAAMRLAALRQGLREFGWIEGQNLAIEYRWAAGQPARLPAYQGQEVQP